MGGTKRLRRREGGAGAIGFAWLGLVTLLAACHASSTAMDPAEPVEPSQPDSSAGAGASAGVSASGGVDRDSAYYREFVRLFSRLDALCWSIVLQINLEGVPEDAVLTCRYDAGGTGGPGVVILAEDANSAIRSALEEIEPNARASTSAVSEAQLFAIEDLIEQLVERCWYVKIEKSSDQWTVTGKELLEGTLYSKTGVGLGTAAREVLREALEQLDR